MNRIKQLRQERKLLQTELAQQMQVSQGTLSNWESGRYEPDLESIVKLQKIFDVSADYLLGLDTKKEPATVSDGGQAHKLAQILRDVGVNVDGLTEADMLRIGKIIKAALEG